MYSTLKILGVSSYNKIPCRYHQYKGLHAADLSWVKIKKILHRVDTKSLDQYG